MALLCSASPSSAGGGQAPWPPLSLRLVGNLMKRMPMFGHRAAIAAVLGLPACLALNAQTPVRLPAIHPVDAIVARTTAPLANVANARVLSDGRILVNDDVANRVLLLDSASLTRARTILDTTSETAKAYGTDKGRLFAFFGDSSLFADVGSDALIVIDPNGKVARTMAAPRGTVRGRDVGSTFLQAPGSAPCFDGRGHLVYLDVTGGHRPAMFDSVVWTGSETPKDSFSIVRTPVGDSRLDTLGWVSQSKFFNVVLAGKVPGMQAGNPLPEIDHWTVLADGTVAVVRAHDFHIDWIAPDGGVTASPRLAHEWTHLTDSMKAAIVDLRAPG